jgi:thiosulfate/3-mercaptopyruvate sulfurtransferase
VSRRDALVDTDWLEEHLEDPGLVVLEVNERPLLYRLGHIPGAHCVDWRSDLQDPVTRDVPDREAMSLVDANIAVPVNAAVAANVLTEDSIAYADATQDANLDQSNQ